MSTPTNERFQRKIAQRGLATTEWIFLLPWGISMPSPSCTDPRAAGAQGQGLTRAGQDCAQRHKGRREALADKCHTHKATQSHGRGRAAAGLLQLEGLQGDRHGWLGVQGHSSQVTPPFLPTAANQTGQPKKYP